jgi:hypothetical protein
VGTIAERLKNNNVNEEFLADQLTEILNDKDPKNSTLRKWALETTMKIMETGSKTEQGQDSMLQSASDSLSSLMSSIN